MSGVARFTAGLKLSRGLAVVETDQGVIVDGGIRRYLFSGASAKAVLPPLLAALDGERTYDRLRDHLQWPAAELDKALRLLEERGLLEEPLAARAADPHPQAVVYFSRTFSALRERFTGSAHVLDTLASAHVVIVGAADGRQTLGADLFGAGVGRVTFLDSPAPLVASLSKNPPDLVLLDDTRGGPDLETAHRLCSGADVPLLRFARYEAAAEVGPLFYREATTCPRCLRAATTAPAQASAERGQALDGVLVGLLCTEVLSLLTTVGDRRTHKGLTRLSLRDYTETRFHLLPEDGCGLCGGGYGAVAAYEWQHELLPRRITTEPPWEPRSEQAEQELRRRRAQFPYSPAAPLPQPSARAMPDGAPASPADPALLSRLLARIAGFRDDDGTERWVPSSGDLASAEVYLLSPGERFGLPGNVQRYTDTTHSLISVRRHDAAFGQLLDGVDLPPPEPGQAVLILIAALGRLRDKYDALAHRLALLDAGGAAMELATFAHAAGLPVRFASVWPADLGTRLELMPERELVTAVALLGDPDARRSPCL